MCTRENIEMHKCNTFLKQFGKYARIVKERKNEMHADLKQ